MQNMILSDTEVYKFIGGELALDFCNTGADREVDFVGELLHSYRGLVSWAHQAQLLNDSEAMALAALGNEHPSEANNIYQHAVTLREALYRTFSAIAAERTPNDADLDILNSAVAEGLGHLRLQQSGDGFEWAWTSQPDDMDRMLWPVAKAATDLLLSPDRFHLRECGNGNCSWLFLDLSRNHSRRWCTMESCGNRVKARGYRQRKANQE